MATRRLVALGLLVTAGSGCGLLLDLDGPSGAADAGTVPGDDAHVGPDARPASDASTSTRDAARGTDARTMAADASTADAARPLDASGALDGGSAVDAGARLAVGEACIDDADCATGYCYDVNVANRYCYGTTCTIGCASADECMAYATAHGGSAAAGSCVLHTTSGAGQVCDFSTGSLPGAAIRCE